MLAAEKAEELGCKTGNYKCLCTKKDFIYGLRDCSMAVCGKDQKDVDAAVKFGMDLCSRKSSKCFKGLGP